MAYDPNPKPELVIASHNKGKIEELKFFLKDFSLSLASDYNLEEPEETGNTFEENATLKASLCAEKTNKPSLGDDGGLVIPALGGNPGLYSARWAGPERDFTKAINRIHLELSGKMDGIEAFFVCALCFVSPNKKSYLFRGECHGNLVFPPRGIKGFGYDSIFIPTGMRKTVAELNFNEKMLISHRSKAFEAFNKYCEESSIIAKSL